MKDLKKLAAECERDLRSIGISPGCVDHWTVNTRAKRRWGLCRTSKPGHFDISISERLLQDDVDDQAAKDTIMHELLHTVKDCYGHTGLWKELAEQVNRVLPQYTVKRASSEAEKGVETTERAQTVQYTVRCTKCGKEYNRVKASKLILHPEKYRCGLCGSRLTRVK